LVVTYQGAHASRPADEVDVDSFIAVKSHRAKGKRITTYDVASLSFIEPEEPIESEEEPMVDDEPMDTAEEMIADDGMDIGEAMDSVADTDDESVEVEPMDDSAVEEVVMDITPEQLNLF
jgi:topoisomerase-4 subunit A